MNPVACCISGGGATRSVHNGGKEPFVAAIGEGVAEDFPDGGVRLVRIGIDDAAEQQGVFAFGAGGAVPKRILLAAFRDEFQGDTRIPGEFVGDFYHVFEAVGVSAEGFTGETHVSEERSGRVKSEHADQDGGRSEKDGTQRDQAPGNRHAPSFPSIIGISQCKSCRERWQAFRYDVNARIGSDSNAFRL